jgi:hypothetical protein
MLPPSRFNQPAYDGGAKAARHYGGSKERLQEFVDA